MLKLISVQVKISRDFTLDNKLSFNKVITQTSDVSRVFVGKPVHSPNPRTHLHGWIRAEKFSKCVSPDALKMHSLVLSVLRFRCKTISILLSFHYETLFFVDDFLKDHNSTKKFVWLLTCKSCEAI